jgi:hypothetical protein
VLDEYRCGRPYGHLRHRALRLRDAQQRSDLLVHVPHRGAVRLPLRLPSPNDSHGGGQYGAAAATTAAATPSASTTTTTCPRDDCLQGAEGGRQEACYRTPPDCAGPVQRRPCAAGTLSASAGPRALAKPAGRCKASARGSCEPRRQPRAACLASL